MKQIESGITIDEKVLFGKSVIKGV